MKCPICNDGRHLYVYRTIHQEGITVRLRRCVRMHEFWTHETILMDKGSDPALTTDDIVELLQHERG